MTVENLSEDFGGEAFITEQLRTEFPGYDGYLETRLLLPTALRKERNQVDKPGHRMFFKHALLKKLEDYFTAKGFYQFSHITRPLGSTDSYYLYEWAEGSEGFAWSYINKNLIEVPVRLDEWGQFISAYDKAGINLGIDIADNDDGKMAKNVIHQRPNTLSDELNRMWKRIDFGPSSSYINFDKLEDYLIKSEIDIKNTLRNGFERFEFMWLASKYLDDKNNMSVRDFDNLKYLTRKFRESTINHLFIYHIGPDINPMN